MVLTVTFPSKVIFECVHKDISNLRKEKLKAVIKEILKPRQEELGTLELPLWAITKAYGDIWKFKMRFWHS